MGIGNGASELQLHAIARDDDVAAGAVSFRYRDGTQNNGVAIDAAIEEIVTAINDRVQV